ncbi:MAG: hypothetical protein JO244_03695 [Solirubrobacterales bacterium]|nr:hypothetical protein [Solirubrobacterales bacterium]
MRARVVPAVLTRSIAVAFAALALAAAPAAASRGQVAIFQDDPALLSNPVATLQEMRHLGVQMVRVSVRWSFFAPAPNSHRRPRFNPYDPNAYPAGNWAQLDALVTGAAARGIQVMLVPTGFAPLWAQGPNPGRYGGRYDSYFAWEPSAGQFGAFVHAVGQRYSGSFTPRGQISPLPRVRFWELYNEPNFGEDLAPQAIDGSSVLAAPRMYRALADAGWSSLAATGHGRDTILIGALAAAGAQAKPGRGAPQGLPGTYGETKPLAFIRDLYCLDGSYRRYLGRAAALRGCPTTAAGYRRFRSQNPVLFKSSGFSDHPYVLGRGLPPTQSDSTDPGYAEFNQLGRFAATLDRIQRIYGSGKRFPIWNTEYGYVTCPPTCHDTNHNVSPTTAAYYVNWAEYLSWRNPRIANTMQYLLDDPNPSVGEPEFGGFSSGLIFYPTIQHGAAKPAYNAYRLPLFLPIPSARRGRPVQVWGAVRPAPFAVADGDGPQYAQVQFARPRGAWTTVKQVPITDPHGYFDTWVTFPSTGSVRILWNYPTFDPSLYSYQDQTTTTYAEPLAPAASRTASVKIT